MNKYIMESMQMFKDIVREVSPSEIPVRYIAAASFLEEDGTESVVYGDDLVLLMAREAPYDNIREGAVNLLLDLRLLTIDMAIEITEIFENIYAELKNK